MNQFEREYYESSSFWEGELLQDEANMLRFARTADLIPDSVKSIADIGCGNGVFAHFLSKNRPQMQVVAVDRSAKALEFVNVEKVQSDITNLPFRDDEFDCVTCLEVLEHLTIADYDKALKELSRVSKKYIILSVPYAEKLENSYTKCPSCATIFNYELHLRNFSEDSFVSSLDKVGFKNNRILKLGEMIQYKGHDLYRKIFYPEQFSTWKSPVCPLCGYKADTIRPIVSDNVSRVTGESSRRKLISYLSAIPKLLWPKQKKHYWIMGLFEKR